MEDSFKGMLKGMIQENNRKQEQPMQDPGKKHDQDFKKINKKQHHFMESPLLHQDHSSCNPHISKHAVEGTYDVYSTMRLIGEHDKKRELHILVDSGSTNNFLDLSIAQSLDCCKLTRTASPVAVSVANGEKVSCSMECLDFEWNMENQHYKSDFLCMPLGGYEMILGIQWLVTLGDILWNFRTLEMRFLLEERYHVLHGIQEGEAITTDLEHEISEGDLDKLSLDFN